MLSSVNPATGATLRTYTPTDPDALERKVALARRAFTSWSRLKVRERTAVLIRAAGILDSERRELGALMTAEMGKLHEAAMQEAAKCALACRYYAENAESILAPRNVTSGEENGSVIFQPLGVVLAIMPWNFPFWQVIRFAAPALAAGNVALLKHASNVPGCAVALEDLFRRAGAPEGVFQSLLIEPDRVADLLGDDRIAAATLTGSEAAGTSVASTAGRHVKKTVLELGGSDPFIVLPSADLEAAVEAAVTARMINNGQSCIAAKRFIVAEAIADDFEHRFVERIAALRVGDPMDPKTELGPLASERLLAELHGQVTESVRLGGKLLTGGRRLERHGAFYAPTVIADPPRGSPAYSQELFGPVAALFRVRDLHGAISLANDSRFGLAASAWTRRREEADTLATELQAGSVFINGMVVSDPRFPFGGVKKSGYGRELSDYGMLEFVNIKTVRMRLPEA